jgi:hypothetical protein
MVEWLKKKGWIFDEVKILVYPFFFDSRHRKSALTGAESPPRLIPNAEVGNSA